MEENMEPTPCTDASENGARVKPAGEGLSRIAAFIQGTFSVLVLMLGGLYLLNRSLTGADEANVMLVNSVVLALMWMSLAIVFSAAYAKHILGRE